MKLSLSARIVESRNPRPGFAEFVALARTAGFDAVGLRSWQVTPETRPVEVRAWRARLEDARLGVFSITTTCDAVPGLVPMARDLGVTLFQVSGTPADLVAAAAHLDADMRLGPQMHTGGDFETVAAAAAALAGIDDPRVGVLVEPANLMFVGMPWDKDVLRPLQGRIVGCNLQSVEVGVGESVVGMRSGGKTTYRRVLLGENTQFDGPAVLGALRAAGYSAGINVIEPARPDMSHADLAAETCQALKKALDAG